MKSGTIQVSELSKETKISKTTLMKAIKHFIDIGLVTIEGKGQSTAEGGKRPNLYRFNPKANYVLAVRIFPSELIAILTDLNCNIIDTRSKRIKINEKINVVINKIVRLYDELIDNNNIDRRKMLGIAVGTHGITNFRDGIIITSPHFSSWGENLPFKDLLENKLPDKIPIIIDNHIRFQVYAEQSRGIGIGIKNIIVLEGGEGLVAGIIVKNSVKRGMHYLAGEIGHMVINPNGEEICACGARGCFEAMISVNRVLKMAKEGYSENKDSMIFKDKDLGDVDIYDIFNSSNQGDRFSRQLISNVVNWFAIGISNMILMYDPELIVIQGIYEKAGDFFISELRKKINTVSLPRINKDVKIEYSDFGKEAAVLGAASYLISNHFFNSN
jgi:predicted NBD/HSP70 family sugar kinase